MPHVTDRELLIKPRPTKHTDYYKPLIFYDINAVHLFVTRVRAGY